MAPSATTEIAPTQLPEHSKGCQKISASVLHGPGDLRLVSYTALLFILFDESLWTFWCENLYR